MLTKTAAAKLGLQLQVMTDAARHHTAACEIGRLCTFFAPCTLGAYSLQIRSSNLAQKDHTTAQHAPKQEKMMFPKINKRASSQRGTMTSAGKGPTALSFAFVAAITLLSAAAVTTSGAMAQGAEGQGPKGQGPNPMDAVAEALDLTPSQMQSCMGPRPEPGTEPSQADRAALVDCLMVQNPSLTPALIDAAMEQMRKAPPPRN